MKRFAFVIVFAIIIIFQNCWSQPLFLKYEHRLILSYFLLSYGLPENEKEVVLKRQENIILNILKQPIEKIEVATFEDFLIQWRGVWPDSHSLDLDLKKIEEKKSQIKYRNIFSKDPVLQEQIEDYQVLEFKSLLLGGSVDAAIGLKNDFSQFKSVSFINKLKTKNFANFFFSEQFQKLDSIGSEIEKNNNFQKIDVGFRRVMGIIFSEYFKRLSLNSKKQAVSIMMGNPINATSDLEKFKALIFSSGPQLQKLLQIIARENNLDSNLRDLFQELEANVKPVPWFLVEEIIENEKNNYNFLTVEKDPIGVGTMAQVHKGKIRDDNNEVQDVVFRFIKPGIEERIAEDKEILMQIAPIIDNDPVLRSQNYPLITPVIDRLLQTVRDELDLNKTNKAQKQGVIAYNSEKKDFFQTGQDFSIKVPSIYDSKFPDSKIMVQEQISGEKLNIFSENYKEEIPDLKRKIAEGLAETWINNVLFKDGFFHADLHQGNFLIEYKNKTVNLNVLDFGMTDVISDSIRNNLFKLGVAVRALNGHNIATALWSISESGQNKISFEKLKLKIQEIVSEIRQGKRNEMSLQGWFSFGLSEGIVFSHQFLNFNRGFVLLDKLLVDAKSNLSMSVLLKKNTLKHPFSVVTALWKEQGINLLDLAKIFYREVSEKYIYKSNQLNKSKNLIRCEQLFLP